MNKIVLRERFYEIVDSLDIPEESVDEIVEELVTAVTKNEMADLFEPDDNEESDNDMDA